MNTNHQSPSGNLRGDRPPQVRGQSAPGKVYTSANELRQAIRSGEHVGPTAGIVPGYAQTNVVILPEEQADDFETFCRRNPRPCPLVARGTPGDYQLGEVAQNADLRSDVPRYRIFRQGVFEQEVTDIRSLWQENLVVFLIGCSFTFESALSRAQLPPRHVKTNVNVPMYSTNRHCHRAGPFAGPLVVSMRPYDESLIDRVCQITARYPKMHGAPVHVGDPGELGIAELEKPDFGDPVPVLTGEVPMFWACGVTPQLALLEAKSEVTITHAPGCMFVTDLSDSDFEES